MTDGIRVCQRSDFEQIADLYRSTFADSTASRSSTLQKYLEQVYLGNPWATEIASPLVSEKSGRIDGFLGVIPQKLQFRGEQINMAVSSALMVVQDESGNRNPITGVGLLRKFLDGKQDLSLTDTANDVTCRIWTASGGSIAHPVLLHVAASFEATDHLCRRFAWFGPTAVSAEPFAEFM